MGPKVASEERRAKAISSKNPAINIGAKEMLSGLAIQISGGRRDGLGLNDLSWSPGVNFTNFAKI